jgi:hypothetical protein
MRRTSAQDIRRRLEQAVVGRMADESLSEAENEEPY